MTEQTGDIGLERQSQPLMQRLTWARAVLTQSLYDLARTAHSAKGRSKFYVELGTGALNIRAIGDPDRVPADPEGLDIIAAEAEGGAIDLVLAEDSCLDLTFSLPPGPLAEVRSMIASEISFKSPFSEDATLAFWQAHEAEAGGWRVRAVITLKDRVMQVAEDLQAADLQVRSLVREYAGGELQAPPPWIATEADTAPSFLSALRNLGAPLRAALFGSTLFLLSAALLWGQTTLRDWSLSAQADAARTQLSATARATARLRGLDTAIAQSTEVLALTGTMSALLPDGIWLDQIIIDNDAVTLVGFGPSAADVTRLLATVPTLSDVQFASPVVRDNSQSIERFRISATLQPGAAR